MGSRSVEGLGIAPVKYYEAPCDLAVCPVVACDCSAHRASAAGGVAALPAAERFEATLPLRLGTNWALERPDWLCG